MISSYPKRTMFMYYLDVGTQSLLQRQRRITAKDWSSLVSSSAAEAWYDRTYGQETKENRLSERGLPKADSDSLKLEMLLKLPRDRTRRLRTSNHVSCFLEQREKSQISIQLCVLEDKKLYYTPYIQRTSCHFILTPPIQRAHDLSAVLPAQTGQKIYFALLFFFLCCFLKNKWLLIFTCVQN